MPPINQPSVQPDASAEIAPVINNAPTTAATPTPAANATDKTPDTKPKNPNSTQNSLLLSEIRDNLVVMADGSFRSVVACKSINFDLMSSREREGVEFSYQNFLNALNHPVQILIRSQRVDIGPYLDKLTGIRNKQDNMLLNVLMDDYINFIGILSQEANIMDKSFYIAIPYFPNGDVANIVAQGKGFFGKLFSKDKNTVTRIDNVSFEKAKTEIKNRTDAVMAGLFQLGVQSVQLGTKELGELYYNFYNPDTAVREPLINFDNITSTYVKKGVGEAPKAGNGEIV